MRLGVHLPQFREPVAGEVLAEAARIAEEAGADGLLVSDHLILPVDSERPPASFHDPLTVLTWAAAATAAPAWGPACSWRPTATRCSWPSPSPASTPCPGGG